MGLTISTIFFMAAMQAGFFLALFFFVMFFNVRRLSYFFMLCVFAILDCSLYFRYFHPDSSALILNISVLCAYILLLFAISGPKGILNSLSYPREMLTDEQVWRKRAKGTERNKKTSGNSRGFIATTTSFGFGKLTIPAIIGFSAGLIAFIAALIAFTKGKQKKSSFNRWISYSLLALFLAEIFSMFDPKTLPANYFYYMLLDFAFIIIIYALLQKAYLEFLSRYFATTFSIGFWGVLFLTICCISALTTFHEATPNELKIILFASLGILLVISVPSLYLARSFSKPIKNIIEQTQTLKEGKLEHFKANFSNVEYNELIDGLNIMVRAIDKNREDLESQITQLKELDKLREEFLANVSHELRTPLTMIIGNSELLLGGIIGELSEEQNEFLQPVYDEALKLLQLITDILNFSKIERGESDVHIELINLPELINQVLTQFIPLAKHRQIKVIRDIPDMKCGSDSEKLKQILVHLLSNAFKFNAKGGKVRVRVRDKKDADENRIIEIDVADTGIGIRPELESTIFDKFRQGDGSATREFGGTGIGLTIVKSFTELLGGTVQVKSAVGKGSQFIVRIPHQDVEKEVEEPIDQEEITFNKENMLIVLIEADTHIAKLLKTYLVQDGYNALALNSGAEAIEQISRLNPNVICLNPKLPDMNGWELMKKIRTNPESSSIPVIIVAGFDNRKLAKKLGASDYHVMPVKRNLFLNSIQRILSR